MGIPEELRWLADEFREFCAEVADEFQEIRKELREDYGLSSPGRRLLLAVIAVVLVLGVTATVIGWFHAFTIVVGLGVMALTFFIAAKVLLQSQRFLRQSRDRNREFEAISARLDEHAARIDAQTRLWPE